MITQRHPDIAGWRCHLRRSFFIVPHARAKKNETRRQILDESAHGHDAVRVQVIGSGGAAERDIGREMIARLAAHQRNFDLIRLDTRDILGDNR
jgi:hypothetical protein